MFQLHDGSIYTNRTLKSKITILFHEIYDLLDAKGHPLSIIQVQKAIDIHDRRKGLLIIDNSVI